MIDGSMKSWFVVAVRLLSICGNALARDVEDNSLLFNAAPYADTNEKAEFVSCGFAMSAEKQATKEREGESFGVKLVVTS